MDTAMERHMRLLPEPVYRTMQTHADAGVTHALKMIEVDPGDLYDLIEDLETARERIERLESLLGLVKEAGWQCGICNEIVHTDPHHLPPTDTCEAMTVCGPCYEDCAEEEGANT